MCSQAEITKTTILTAPNIRTFATYLVFSRRAQSHIVKHFIILITPNLRTFAAYDAFSGRDATANSGKHTAGDPSRRAFTYFMLGSAKFFYASLARLTVLKFVHYMNASADVLALASIEVPIGGIPEGGCIVVK
jgi:hypothetical protein